LAGARSKAAANRSLRLRPPYGTVIIWEGQPERAQPREVRSAADVNDNRLFHRQAIRDDVFLRSEVNELQLQVFGQSFHDHQVAVLHDRVEDSQRQCVAAKSKWVADRMSADPRLRDGVANDGQVAFDHPQLIGELLQGEPLDSRERTFYLFVRDFLAGRSAPLPAP